MKRETYKQIYSKEYQMVDKLIFLVLLVISLKYQVWKNKSNASQARIYYILAWTH